MQKCKLLWWSKILVDMPRPRLAEIISVYGIIFGGDFYLEIFAVDMAFFYGAFYLFMSYYIMS